MSGLLPRLLAIDQDEVKFARRGFSCARPHIRERLEHVGQVFLEGYHAALEPGEEEHLVFRLNQIAAEHRGFAYEGAAMALTLLDGVSLDGVSPRSKWKRLSRFVAGPGRRHIYMVYVGAGWALARLRWLRRRIEGVLRAFHPVLGSLAIDGYGFHEGYFHHQRACRTAIPHLSEAGCHVFYQGLGRSLWFVQGADVRAIASTIATFAQQFQGDAWSGIGLACAYAGGLDPAELEELCWHAAAHRTALAQGAAFAATARQLAGNPAPHTELTCAKLCGISPAQAAALCDQTFSHLAGRNSFSYQAWRQLVQRNLPSSSHAPWQNNSHDFLQPASSKVH
jgi:enediyne biosynthesis protein E3